MAPADTMRCRRNSSRRRSCCTQLRPFRCNTWRRSPSYPHNKCLHPTRSATHRSDWGRRLRKDAARNRPPRRVCRSQAHTSTSSLLDRRTPRDGSSPATADNPPRSCNHRHDGPARLPHRDSRRNHWVWRKCCRRTAFWRRPPIRCQPPRARSRPFLRPVS